MQYNDPWKNILHMTSDYVKYYHKILAVKVDETAKRVIVGLKQKATRLRNLPPDNKFEVVLYETEAGIEGVIGVPPTRYADDDTQQDIERYVERNNRRRRRKT